MFYIIINALLADTTPLDSTIKQALNLLDKISKLKQFDKYLLGNDEEEMPDFSALEPSNQIALALTLLPFYSEDKRTRDYAYESEIKQRIITSISYLKEAGRDVIPKRILILSDYFRFGVNQQLLDTAIRDVYQSDTYGIHDLMEVLKDIQAKKKLTKVSEMKLHYFCILGGFILDKEALRRLDDTLFEFINSIQFDASQLHHKLSLLRHLQIIGETTKHLQGFTLATVPQYPSDLLTDIRNALAHFNKKSLQTVQRAESTPLFARLFKVMVKIHSQIDQMQKQFPECPNEDIEGFWNSLKRQATPTKVTSADEFKDLEELKKLLKYEPRRNKNPTSMEVDEMAIQFVQFNIEETEKEQTRRDNVMRLLQDKKLEQSKLIELGITAEDANNICTKLKNFHISIAKAETKGDRDTLKAQLDEKRKIVALEILQFTQETWAQIDNDMEILRRTRKSIREFLQGVTCNNGHGNLTKKFKEFCENMTACGLNCNGAFNWNSEPNHLELLFHKHTATGITTKNDKLAHKISKLEQLIDLLAEVRNVYKIDLTAEDDADIALFGSQAVLSKEDFTAIINPLKMAACQTRRGYIRQQLHQHIKKQQIKINYHSSQPRGEYIAHLMKQTEDPHSFKGAEFYILASYELLKEISDFPEIQHLQQLIRQLRNYFAHPEPEKDATLNHTTTFSTTIVNNHPKVVATELYHLAVNLIYFLEIVARNLKIEAKLEQNS